ncbi:MAG: hypothetical protein ACI4EI_09025 [Muricoprocola sp.]
MDNIKDNTPYDDVYRTMLNDCTELIIPVVNEMFLENYTGKEPVVLLPEIHFINQQDGNTKEKITDSCFEIRSELPRKFHVECQSTPDGSMAIRFFEYDSQIALDHGELENHKLTLRFPHSGVLYLRYTSKTPDNMEIILDTPGGIITYTIPIMKVADYSIEEIFQKNLLFLLPFHIFRYEKDFKNYEKDKEKLEELTQTYRTIRKRLDTLCQSGEINEYVKCMIIDMMKRVIRQITANYEQIQKGVNSEMGGKVLEYEAKTILNRGIAEGLNRGITEGLNRGILQSLITQVSKKIKKGYSVPEIADQLEESENNIQKIYDVIKESGTDSSLDVIVDKVMESKE